MILITRIKPKPEEFRSKFFWCKYWKYKTIFENSYGEGEPDRGLCLRLGRHCEGIQTGKKAACPGGQDFAEYLGLFVRLVVPLLFHAAAVDQSPGFTRENLAVFEKLGVLHGSLSSNNNIELINLLGFFQKSGRVLASLGMVIIENHSIASHDRWGFTRNFNRLGSFPWRTLLTVATAASSPTATATTVAVAIPVMTGALLIIGTSVQIPSLARLWTVA
jgi:hypothetical protein